MAMNVSALAAVLLALLFALPAPVAPDSSTAAQNVKEWTILVWEDADNNLEGAGVHDLNEMETVGSTRDFNILVQFDRAEGYDTTNGNWTGTKRFYVTSDSDMNTISSKELADLGEVNMGDPQAFINFSGWAIDHYPAKRYLVVFWDHGGGWHGICWDDTDKDYMDLDNVSTAIRGMSQKLGRPVDLVGMDACLMSGVEILYQIRGLCEVAVVSGTTEPNDGWPYDWILPALAMKPYMSDEELAAEITNDYVNSYTDGKPDPQDAPTSTMSAWNMSKMEPLIEQFNQMSMRLAMKAYTYGAYLRAVRDVTESYDPEHVVFLDISNYPLYDIYDFIQNFLQPLGGPFVGLVIDSALRQNMEALQTLLLSARVAERHGPRYPDGYGLTVYWPSGDNSPSPVTPRTQYDARYDGIDSSRELYWDDFLKAYIGMQNVMDTPPYATITSPVEGARLNAADGKVTLAGTAFDTNSVSYVELRIDNGSWKEARGDVNWDFEWDISSLGGTHTVYVRAYDGTTESPEVSRTFVIAPGHSAQSAADMGVALAAGGALVVVLAAALVFLSRKGKLAGLRLALRRKQPALK